MTKLNKDVISKILSSYIEQEMCIKEIAESLNISTRTVGLYLKNFGVVKRQPPIRNKIKDTIVNQIIVDYKSQQYTLKEIAFKYNVSDKTILNLVKRHNIGINRGSVEKDSDLISTAYTNGSTITDIASKYGFSRSFISKVLQLNNVEIKNSSSWKQCITHNPFYDILNPETQYWLGWLASDGCVSKDSETRKRNSIHLKIHKDDVEILRNYVSFLGLTEDKIKSSKTCYVVEFCSKEVKDFLVSLGLTPNKSFTLNPGFKITKDFIRGYFDGDGWFSIGKREKYSYGVFGMCSASIKMINLLQKTLLDDCGLNLNILSKKTQILYEIRTSSITNLKTLYNYLYYQEDLIKLNRKFTKFSNYLMMYPDLDGNV